MIVNQFVLFMLECANAAAYLLMTQADTQMRKRAAHAIRDFDWAVLRIPEYDRWVSDEHAATAWTQPCVSGPWKKSEVLGGERGRVTVMTIERLIGACIAVAAMDAWRAAGMRPCAFHHAAWVMWVDANGWASPAKDGIS